MILYYALGGGLGHLTRGRRVLEALRIEASLVTASSYASDPRVTGTFPVIHVPPHLEGDVDAHREWLRALAPSRMIVDTFPCGIQGELCGLDVPMDLVARPLRWDEYRRAVPGPLPRFERVWRMEDAALFYPRESESGGDAAALLNYWLIVHSGPEDEVRELVAYTEELLRVEPNPERVLVATRCAINVPPNFEIIDAYPVTHLYANATRIVSAAGFNVMLETEPYRDKHHVIPFARKFDDQFARAALRRIK